MGYFPNGTSGALFQDQWCNRCVHDVNEDCPIWNLHLIHNYEECNKPDSFLHDLISNDTNECKLFHAKAENL